ncbi:hypothetical protein JCM33374_g5634 [Metschnikowia sp. JCM 33374]|nr:hypothetical protein JCM33374_g5634 [Metschnikowia sp. JCM 33374]
MKSFDFKSSHMQIQHNLNSNFLWLYTNSWTFKSSTLVVMNAFIGKSRAADAGLPKQFPMNWGLFSTLGDPLMQDPPQVKLYNIKYPNPDSCIRSKPSTTSQKFSGINSASAVHTL